mmetsp:Transcript_36568/g.72851  ORF Transcript_36568/g.72851 Transcript_36568/m.72851 type:complete len:393 (+) Transcript_36568:87-1265(+)
METAHNVLPGIAPWSTDGLARPTSPPFSDALPPTDLSVVHSLPPACGNAWRSPEDAPAAVTTTVWDEQKKSAHTQPAVRPTCAKTEGEQVHTSHHAPQLDFLRALCVIQVVSHHAELRFSYQHAKSQDYLGYPFSQELWVLWFLVILSAYLFTLSSKPIGQYLSRLSAIVALGCTLNTLAKWVATSTDPDGKFSGFHDLGTDWWQFFGPMYYCVAIGVLALLTYPARLHFLQRCKAHPMLMVLSLIVCLGTAPVVVLVTDWVEVVDTEQSSRATCKLQNGVLYLSNLGLTLGVFAHLCPSRGRTSCSKSQGAQSRLMSSTSIIISPLTSGTKARVDPPPAKMVSVSRCRTISACTLLILLVVANGSFTGASSCRDGRVCTTQKRTWESEGAA